MELKEVIENRRSIRKFKNIDISKEIIENLIDCARLAPSTKNRQPWQFVIVKDKIKNQIADIMLDNIKENLDVYKSSVKETAMIIKEAPILILVLKQYDINWATGDTLSIGAAIEHICLRATDLGLGSLWIRDTNSVREEIVQLIKHEDMELISSIAIGYPNESPRQRPRKKLNEVLEWYY